MSFNKIPFGLQESNNELVDVYDVPNGKQCGCVCPSCSTTLEARQGDINVWHFAHASKNVYTKTKNECQYSFYLSVRLMARQIIGKQIKLNLPEYKGSVEYYDEELGTAQRKKIVVSPERDIVLDNVEVEDTFQGMAVDLVGTIGEFRFVVYFTHDGRYIPENLFKPTDPKCGIIGISLDLLQIQFKAAKSEGKTYQEILTDFLTNDRQSKSWIYHPRFEIVSALAVEEMKKEASILKEKKAANLKKIEANSFKYKDIYGKNANHLSYSLPKPSKHGNDNLSKNYNFIAENKPLTEHRQKLTNFECVICKVRWEGYEAGGNQCPKCRSYLYSKQVSVSDPDIAE